MKKTIAIAICTCFILPANAQNSTPSNCNSYESLKDGDSSLGRSLKDLTNEMSGFENLLKRRQKIVDEDLRKAKLREALNKKKGAKNSGKNPLTPTKPAFPNNSVYPANPTKPNIFTFPSTPKNVNTGAVNVPTGITGMPTREKIIKNLQELQAQRSAVDPGSKQYADLSRTMGQLQTQLTNLKDLSMILCHKSSQAELSLQTQ